MSEWRPIEQDTPPGIYLVCSTRDVAEGDYAIETMQINGPDDPEHRFFNLNSHNYSRPDWWTHWMPLPKPPVPDSLAERPSTDKKGP